MNTQKYDKLKNLLQLWPAGTVATQDWLTQIGISRFLLRQYTKSGWVRSVGAGAVIRSQEKISFNACLYALQNQLKLSVHLGGLTALVMHGRGHYIKGDVAYDLFASAQTRLPKWFLDLDNEFKQSIKIYKTNFLPATEYLQKHEINDGIEIFISSLERAIFEVVYLTPEVSTFEETNYIFENLGQLRPTIIQKLLECCKSKKVKRLFLTFATLHNHAWLKELSLEKVDIGRGILSLSKGGVYYKPYKIVIPKNLVENEEQTLF